MANKKVKRALTRKEVSGMLGHLPTNDTELLEVMLDVLMRAADEYPEINLEKLTDAMIDLDEGFNNGDKDTDRFIKAKRYVQRTKLGFYILESLEELYS